MNAKNNRFIVGCLSCAGISVCALGVFVVVGIWLLKLTMIPIQVNDSNQSGIPVSDTAVSRNEGESSVIGNQDDGGTSSNQVEDMGSIPLNEGVKWDELKYTGFEGAVGIVQTDSGFVVVAKELSAIHQGVPLLGINRTGEISSLSTIGSIYTNAGQVIITSSGYAVVGINRSHEDFEDSIFFVEFDSNSKITCKSSFGTINEDVSVGIIELEGGGYVLAHNSITKAPLNEDTYITLLDENCKALWHRGFLEETNDTITALAKTSDGGYVVAGKTTVLGSDYSTTLWVYKFNSNHELEWEMPFGGDYSNLGRDLRPHGRLDPITDHIGISSILETNNGNYLIGMNLTGDGMSALGEGLYGRIGMVNIVMLDNSGQFLWQRQFAGKHKLLNSDVVESGSGGYVLIGSAYSMDENNLNLLGRYKPWFVRLDNQGNVYSQKAHTISDNESEGSIPIGYVRNEFGELVILSLFQDGMKMLRISDSLDTLDNQDIGDTRIDSYVSTVNRNQAAVTPNYLEVRLQKADVTYIVVNEVPLDSQFLQIKKQ